MSGSSTSQRIVSMDQFRGYTVAGMFVVNFLSSFAVIHPLLKHNDIYFSYADSIMPSFMFAVGFSFRLTYLRRIVQAGYWPTAWHYIKRSFALVVISLVMYGFGTDYSTWHRFTEMPPEFEPFRLKPPPTRSFDELIAQARKANPRADERTIVQAALEIGASITDSQTQRSEDPRSAAARRAASVVEEEGREFVRPAVGRIEHWESLSSNRRLLIHLRIAAGKLLKAALWETLALIGITQLVVLPFVGASFLGRFAVLVLLGSAHLLLSEWFNWDFVYGIHNNWLAKLWMTGTDRSWDGGFFGPICWAISMLAGTLAYDLVSGAASRRVAVRRLVVWGIAFMVVGYAMSCLTRLYDLPEAALEARRVEHLRQQAEKDWLELLKQVEQSRFAQVHVAPGMSIEPEINAIEARIQVLSDQQQAYPNLELAEGPVHPPWGRLTGRSWWEMLAEPPFVAPPMDDPETTPEPQIEHRPRNYWMLGKRMPNLSFMTFASGFAFALYGLFVVACDMGGLAVGFFRTFGTNALVAYFLHHVIEEQVAKLVPHDSELWYCLGGFAFFFLLTYACVRYLEKQKIYLKL
jgi:predicted acyltransferase